VSTASARASESRVAAAPATASAGAASNADAGEFTILVATFSTRERADNAVAELNGAGYHAQATERDWGPPRGRLVLVSVGGYSSALDVERDLQRIRQLPGGYADARIAAR
jgi:cell division septation protein DedD